MAAEGKGTSSHDHGVTITNTVARTTNRHAALVLDRSSVHVSCDHGCWVDNLSICPVAMAAG